MCNDTASILIVDDDRKAAMGLRSQLKRRFGWDADVETDGSRAATMIRTGAYSVVILDIVMPGLSGLEVLDMISDYLDEVHVLILTGSTSEAAEAKKRGAKDFVMKPVTPKQLRPLGAKIKSALNENRKRRNRG